LVAARLQGFDRALDRAAADLGANTFNRLRLVVLPLIFPAIVAAALLAFTLSIDEFIITYFLIGTQITLPIYIYTQIKFGITPDGAAAVRLIEPFDVELVATFLPLRLDDEDDFDDDLRALDRTTEVLAATGGGLVLLADAERPGRAAISGQPAKITANGLSEDQ